jgi:thiosulfate reductase / polysulfide reductase chain A
MRDRGSIDGRTVAVDQAVLNRLLIGDAPIDQVALRRDGFAEFPYELGNFSAQFFKMPSGKIELYSSTLENFGLGPVPDHVTARVSAEFPLVLQTGRREKTFAARRTRRRHAGREGRDIDRLCKQETRSSGLPRLCAL